MEILANNIKRYRIQKNVSQKDLADILDVSQTTISHYEKGSRQPVIENLIKLANLFEVPVDQLVGNDINKVNKLEIGNKEIVNNLVNFILLKQEYQFLDYIKILNRNISAKEIFEDILKEVMYEIGQLWEKGDVTVAMEHYATNVVRKAINYIYIDNNLSLKNRKAILLATPHEQHTLGIEMISSYLELNGVESINVGSNVPLRSLTELIDIYQPDFVMISVTLRDHINGLEVLLESIKDSVNKVIIGGQASKYLDDFNLIENKIEVVNDLKTLKHLINN
jgi:methanogenic corrinoid protein MtbC1